MNVLLDKHEFHLREVARMKKVIQGLNFELVRAEQEWLRDDIKRLIAQVKASLAHEMKNSS